MEKHSVSRLSYLFAHLHLLSSDSFSLFYSPLLSASAQLCFSSVHIVGSLTSKLPSIITYLSSSNICLFIIDFFTTHCKLTLSLVTLNSVRSSWTGCPRGCDERSCDLPWRQRCFQHPIYHGRLWGYEEVKSPIFPLYDNHYQSFKSLF